MMKRNSYIGYGIAIFGGLAVIVSMLLSLSMEYLIGNFIQGASVIDFVIGKASLSGVLTVIVLLFLIGAVISLVNIIMAIVGIVKTAKVKNTATYLLVNRLLASISFGVIVASFIVLGVYLAGIVSISYNIIGFAPVIALLGCLLQIFGMFLVRAKENSEKSKEV